MYDVPPGSLWTGRHPLRPGQAPTDVTVRITHNCPVRAYFEIFGQRGTRGGLPYALFTRRFRRVG